MYNSEIFFLKFLLKKMPRNKYVIGNLALDVLLRVFLLCLYGTHQKQNDFVIRRFFQLTPPFKRVIHAEEAWMYKNPITDSYCPMNLLWEIVVVVPSAMIFANYIIHRDKNDVFQAFLAFTLTISLNGAVTNILKVVVGRPRPDFYYRCFPNGEGNLEMTDCTGDINLINDGLKSFPSGHSSIAFASLGFMSLYMAGKMHVFAADGKGSTWKLLLFFFPLLVACVIAVSRTCDYHHHWQDVLCGSLLGFAICWLCYHNYYPPLYVEKCHIPWLDVKSKLFTEPIPVKEV